MARDDPSAADSGSGSVHTMSLGLVIGQCGVVVDVLEEDLQWPIADAGAATVSGRRGCVCAAPPPSSDLYVRCACSPGGQLFWRRWCS